MISQKFVSVIYRSISRSSALKAKEIKLNLTNDTVTVPVETDTEKLANYVCGTNLFITGENVKLKPDSEYPEWLWKIRSPPPLEELDKNSKTYWYRVRRMREQEHKHLLKFQRHRTLQK